MDANQLSLDIKAIWSYVDKMIRKDKYFNHIINDIDTNDLSLKDAYEYSRRVSIFYKQGIEEVAKKYVDEGKDVYESVMYALENGIHNPVNDFAKKCIGAINRKNGFNIQGIPMEFDKERASGLAHQIANPLDDESWQYTVDQISNFSDSVVSGVTKENVAFAKSNGINPQIRWIAGDCCEWCSKKEGVYGYPQPKSLYVRHNNCKCYLEYYPGRGRLAQNVWDKKWR